MEDKRDISIKKYLDEKFGEINRRLDENSREHQFINKYLESLEERVEYNTTFRIQNSDLLKNLASDRERKVRKVLDIILILTFLAVLITIGGDDKIELINLLT